VINKISKLQSLKDLSRSWFESMPGSHLLLFELSLPVISPQFWRSTALFARNGAFRRGLGASDAVLGCATKAQRGLITVELAGSLRLACQGAPLFNSLEVRSRFDLDV
jgi:hypothetical protein